MEWSEQTVVVATPQHVASDLGREIVLLHLEKGAYFGLDEVGAEIWKRIQTPTSLGAIRDAIVKRYEVQPERCMSDLRALMGELGSERLVEVVHASGR